MAVQQLIEKLQKCDPNAIVAKEQEWSLYLNIDSGFRVEEIYIEKHTNGWDESKYPTDHKVVLIS
jgi:hypothetical protein